MKIFKILFRYADGKYTPTRGQLNFAYVEAKDVEDAKVKYAYSGVIAVREISIDEIMGGEDWHQ